MRRIAAIAALVLAVIAGLGWWGLRMESPEEPLLPGTLIAGSLEHGGHTRTWQAYVPARPLTSPALVFVLHGSMGDGAQARGGYAYAFDELAEREGFLAIYPDGFERHWNDCRKAGPYTANTQDIDDVGFLAAVVDRFVAERGADPERVFATGISNGGQMALRLALEAPERMRAVAPVVASLPAGPNFDCESEGRPVSTLIMNGTADPMNPYEGGEVALYGIWGNRGAVLSTEDSIDYFRELAGHAATPTAVERLPDRDAGDDSRVEVRSWSAAGRANVSLYVIENGGHSAPHPAITLPRILGPTNHDISAAEEIWNFFAAAP